MSLELPDDWRENRRALSLEDYDELDQLLHSLRDRSLDLWFDAMRWLCLNDLFFLATRVDTVSGAMDETSGTLIFRRPFILDRCRDIEDEEHMVFDYWGRGTGKSTLKTKIRNYQTALIWPETANFIFSYDKEAAKAHLQNVKEELEKNELLRRLFPDRLWWNPGQECSRWSMADGLCIKRNVARREATFEAHGLRLRGLPTGRHPNRHDIDDAEDDRRVASKDMIDELKKAYAKSGNIKHKGRFTRTLTSTGYSPIGLVAQWIDDPNVKVRFFPGENLAEPGGGPLGGSPLKGFFTVGELWAWYAEMGDRRSYAEQVALDLNAGQARRFRHSLIKRTDEDPEKMGRHCFVYICEDPTPGHAEGGDQAAIWVWGCRQDRRFVWLDAVFRRMSTGERHEEGLRLYKKWHELSLGVVQYRVEEFGQSDYVHPRRQFMRDHYVDCEVVKCCDNRSSKEERLFNRWSAQIDQERIIVPRVIMCETEDGGMINVASYFLSAEIGKWPKPLTDHLLDAGSLLWEDPEDDRYGAIRFPTPEDLEVMAHPETIAHHGSYQSVGIL